MEQIFVSNIAINKVRHLKDINIGLSERKRKHLIITGKNGSGKTSVLDAIATVLNSMTVSSDLTDVLKSLNADSNALTEVGEQQDSDEKFREIQKRLLVYKEKIDKLSGGVVLGFNSTPEDIRAEFNAGNFVVAYYRADRIFNAETPKHVEKVILKKHYKITESPRENFIKYLLDLKMTQALAIANGKAEKAEIIRKWFERFQGLLREIFEDESVVLDFDEDTYRFYILIDGREPFEFNTLSSGYAAVLDIVVDLMLRMEGQTNRVFDFLVPGVVLIDEVETHLHLALQKKILGLLTMFFPNIQFVISTHSPFIINSLENVVIYDLEKHLLVRDGLADVPYDGIVEGYFDSDKLSDNLKQRFERYKVLAEKDRLTDNDLEEIAELEVYLNEIPDYLALDITTEYQRLQINLRNREDF